MRISVRDNVKTPHRIRRHYLSMQVEELLNRRATSVHQVDVTLSLEGHNGDAEHHCHVTASLGSLGVIVADWRDADEHQAFRGAMARLIRGISRRIGKRQSRRHHRDEVGLTAVD